MSDPSFERTRLERAAFSRDATSADVEALRSFESAIVADPGVVGSAPSAGAVQSAEVEQALELDAHSRSARPPVVAVVLVSAAAGIAAGIAIGSLSAPVSSLAVFDARVPASEPPALVEDLNRLWRDAGPSVDRSLIYESRLLGSVDGVQLFGAVGVRESGDEFAPIVCLIAEAQGPESQSASCDTRRSFFTNGLTVESGGAEFRWGPTGGPVALSQRK